MSEKAVGNRQPVRTEEQDGILIVTIDRPEARNAINADVARGVAAAVERIDTSDEIRLGIITGANGTFCSGMDLKAFAAGESAWVEGRGFAGIVQRPPVKPLIAAVEGYALAGGWEVALCADLIVASREATFGLPEVRRGLVALGGGLLRLPERLPYHLAVELVLTGRHATASELSEYGAVNRLVEPGTALVEALALGRELAANGPLALTASKRILNGGMDWGADERWEQQERIGRPIMRSEDAREGAIAFAEKREPRWRGR